ncbi:MAG TPA: YXWGXW repeat-containing protein [Bryocella sp.]|nr:YXWGXW repeat-containing protein [Bryocella sp.]
MNTRKIVSRLLMGAALAVFAAALAVPGAHAGVIVSVNFAPPALPVYAQPVCPGAGYLWTPGYWAYGPEGYYWVPGVWVQPPAVGLLWTPAWWGWEGGAYIYHAGYWGPHVGFYGGINYGFGYSGVGFVGGEWRGGAFFYNRSVANIDVVHVTNVYVRNVAIVNHSTVAFNGGRGGIQVRPTSFEMVAIHEHHFQPTANQLSHESFAARNRSLWASFNHGRPTISAAASVSAFHDQPDNPGLAARPGINQREANQDQRIANGLRDGQMTPGEAARSEHTQANIDRQIHTDRMANDGALTNQERRQVSREQNKASRQIYRENHNNNREGKGR